MAGRAWLSDQRGELAAERILDAAEKLFAQQDPGSVGMNEIARAAGCSRATLYRYFESRDALHTAYVHRWANALYRELTQRLAGIELDLVHQLVIFFVAMLGAIGAPGIPSVGMLSMVLVLESVGLPTAAIAILLPIDRILDTTRTMVNVQGDMVGALIVQKLADRPA